MIGVKDEIYGEEVVAWIVPDREVSDTKQMVSGLLKLAEGKLAHCKLPAIFTSQSNSRSP